MDGWTVSQRARRMRGIEMESVGDMVTDALLRWRWGCLLMGMGDLDF